MAHTYYKRGSANAICDVCGLKYKLDQLQKRWDGVWVCHDDYEERHPQEFIRSKMDSNKLVIVKPRPAPVFVNVCTINGRSGFVGLAMAGCSVVGNTMVAPVYGPDDLETGTTSSGTPIFVWTDS